MADEWKRVNRYNAAEKACEMLHEPVARTPSLTVSDLEFFLDDDFSSSDDALTYTPREVLHVGADLADLYDYVDTHGSLYTALMEDYIGHHFHVASPNTLILGPVDDPTIWRAMTTYDVGVLEDPGRTSYYDALIAQMARHCTDSLYVVVPKHLTPLGLFHHLVFHTHYPCFEYLELTEGKHAIRCSHSIEMYSSFTRLTGYDWSLRLFKAIRVDAAHIDV